MHSLATIAARLHYSGRDRERSVRRLFARHRVPIIKRGRGAYFVSDAQFTELIDACRRLDGLDGAARTLISLTIRR